VLNALENHAIQWVHFGDGELLEALKKRVDQTKRVGLEVEFRGRVSNEEVLKSYAQLNPWLFINLSSSEGIPVSIMEACSMGIPVVATAIGGTPEIVSEELGALVNAMSSLEQVKDVVKNMLQLSIEDWNKKADAAFSIWSMEYQAERNFRNFANVLKELSE
jgi:colanic acid/amylovoran biosynthesis glycosyltransferase